VKFPGIWTSLGNIPGNSRKFPGIFPRIPLFFSDFLEIFPGIPRNSREFPGNFWGFTSLLQRQKNL
jgi:hypothetical protein